MSYPDESLWAAYVAAIGEGLTQQDIAVAAGVNQSTVGRWLNGKTAPTEAAVVALLAQRLERNPLEAFVAAGFLTKDEAARGLDDESTRLLAKLREQVESVKNVRLQLAKVIIDETRRREARGEVVTEQMVREWLRAGELAEERTRRSGDQAG
jgi:transcriptional regulator with XRE-family HTH domain